MYRFAQDNDTVDFDELHERLGKMSDQQLQQFGEAARFMCSKGANMNKPPRKPFAVQLEEAIAEWKRRNPGHLPSVKDEVNG